MGLTLAIALNAFDKERKLAIDIYEAAPELGEIGAGINVWPRTLAIFKQIGLEDALIPLLDHIPDLEPRTSSYSFADFNRSQSSALSRNYFWNPKRRPKEWIQSL